MDDVSISESPSRNSESHMQNHLDEFNTRAGNNLMKLNPKKCKEMHVCFLKERPILERLNLREQPLEIVSRHKVLSLVIQDNLNWNGHIAMIVKKASKRFHILRVLKWGGIPTHKLILIYYALIQSVLEYCCIVWHKNLPAYLADSMQLNEFRKEYWI